jgi:hypothetical protein
VQSKKAEKEINFWLAFMFCGAKRIVFGGFRLGLFYINCQEFLKNTSNFTIWFTSRYDWTLIFDFAQFFCNDSRHENKDMPYLLCLLLDFTSLCFVGQNVSDSFCRFQEVLNEGSGKF